MQLRDGADDLAVHDPRQRVGEVEAGLQRALAVGLVGEQHHGVHAFQQVRQRAAHERIVREVGVRCQQDGKRCVLGVPRRRPRGFQLGQGARLPQRRGAFGLLLRAGGRFPGALRLARARVALRGQLDERVLHAFVLVHLVHQARQHFDALVGEGVGHEVGQRLELRAEPAPSSYVGDAGHEHGVARARIHQRGHMPQVDLRGQAALVVGQGVPARHGGSVGGRAEHDVAAQRLEERRPQRAVAVVQQRARHADAARAVGGGAEGEPG